MALSSPAKRKGSIAVNTSLPSWKSDVALYDVAVLFLFLYRLRPFQKAYPLLELRHAIRIEAFIFNILAGNILAEGNIVLFLGHAARVFPHTDTVRIIFIPSLLGILTEYYFAIRPIKYPTGNRSVYLATHVHIVTIQRLHEYDGIRTATFLISGESIAFTCISAYDSFTDSLSSCIGNLGTDRRILLLIGTAGNRQVPVRDLATIRTNRRQFIKILIVSEP